MVLEDEAEGVEPVAGLDVQALRAGDDLGVRPWPVAHRPVVDRGGAHGALAVDDEGLVGLGAQGRVEQVQALEAKLATLSGRGAGSDLEARHGLLVDRSSAKKELASLLKMVNSIGTGGVGSCVLLCVELGRELGALFIGRCLVQVQHGFLRARSITNAS